MNDNQILDAFVQVFSWLYEVDIPDMERSYIEGHIRAGWGNDDPSEQQLVAFVVDLYKKLNGVQYPELHREKIQQHFANEFSVLARLMPNQLSDKYRVLLVIHTIVETHRSGATGLPLMPTCGSVMSDIADMRYQMLETVAQNLRDEEDAQPAIRTNRGH